jgi:hypothetical protein
MYKQNDIFYHAGYAGTVVEVLENGMYKTIWGPANLPMKLKEEWMTNEHVKESDQSYLFNNDKKPNIVVCDNFYQNPDHVRNLALCQEYMEDKNYHKGSRTKDRFLFPWVKERIEELLGAKIPNWMQYGTNGVFQYCPAETPIVYHSDSQSYAAVVYLTPNAPFEAGTSFLASKKVKGRRAPATVEEGLTIEQCNQINDLMYKGNLLDKTAWEVVDVVGNVYNRLAIWESKTLHAASCYFGTDINDSRLFQLFFFDVE